MEDAQALMVQLVYSLKIGLPCKTEECRSAILKSDNYCQQHVYFIGFQASYNPVNSHGKGTRILFKNPRMSRLQNFKRIYLIIFI